jgi:hypothetical protein
VEQISFQERARLVQAPQAQQYARLPVCIAALRAIPDAASHAVEARGLVGSAVIEPVLRDQAKQRGALVRLIMRH